ncbi:MAG: hypothetical protein HY881_06525 [Deltaproteobacteria bacterium]|nr:hypothetical protein [Deltaproteobacteria bacterium]
MTDSKVQGNGRRVGYNIPIYISFFNSKYSVEAQLVDHCTDGISFISDQDFFLGSAIIFRVAPCTLKGSGYSDLEILPSIRIGEVKWCRKLPGETPTAYEVGLKYYPQVY